VTKKKLLQMPPTAEPEQPIQRIRLTDDALIKRINRTTRRNHSPVLVKKLRGEYHPFGSEWIWGGSIKGPRFLVLDFTEAAFDIFTRSQLVKWAGGKNACLDYGEFLARDEEAA
jgi:hypothetical protein